MYSANFWGDLARIRNYRARIQSYRAPFILLKLLLMYTNNKHTTTTWNNHHNSSLSLSLHMSIPIAKRHSRKTKQSIGLRSSPPLQFNLDPPVLWIYEMVLLVDPFVVDNIWHIDIHIAQTFLVRERERIWVNQSNQCRKILHNNLIWTRKISQADTRGYPFKEEDTLSLHQFLETTMPTNQRNTKRSLTFGSSIIHRVHHWENQIRFPFFATSQNSRTWTFQFVDMHIMLGKNMST